MHIYAMNQGMKINLRIREAFKRTWDGVGNCKVSTINFWSKELAKAGLDGVKLDKFRAPPCFEKNFKVVKSKDTRVMLEEGVKYVLSTSNHDMGVMGQFKGPHLSKGVVLVEENSAPDGNYLCTRRVPKAY